MRAGGSVAGKSREFRKSLTTEAKDVREISCKTSKTCSTKRNQLLAQLCTAARSVKSKLAEGRTRAQIRCGATILDPCGSGDRREELRLVRRSTSFRASFPAVCRNRSSRQSKSR